MPSRSSSYCHHCGKLYKTNKKLEAHRLRRGLPLGEWPCVDTSCDSILEGFSNLLAHVDTEHPKYSKTKKQSCPDGTNKTGQVISCPMCEKKSANFPNWRRHAIQFHIGGMCETDMNYYLEKKCNAASGDCKEPITITLDSDTENETEDDHDDDDDSSTSDDSCDNDVQENSRCEACFCKPANKIERGMHNQLKHFARKSDGKAQCQVCREHVDFKEFAKHGIQKHIQEFLVHCHFCNQGMTYIALIMHALTCQDRPATLDNATLLHALAEGRVPEALSEKTRNSDAAAPGNLVETLTPPADQNNNSVAVKKEEPN